MIIIIVILYLLTYFAFNVFKMNYYPPQLTDWWMDDWISLVYGKQRTFKAKKIMVVHHTSKIIVVAVVVGIVRKVPIILIVFLVYIFTSSFLYAFF